MEKPQQGDVSKWYLELGKKAQLFDYGPVKGTIIMRPYSYAIWEMMQKELDQKIKSLGCQNVYFPLFIPEEFLKREAKHVEGFSPELAVVTYAGGEKLKEAIVVRPTSETIMYDAFSRWIGSWRDLPFKINQWVNVVRWELRSFPFIRGSEFLWQEGHTAHQKAEEADAQTIEALEMYKDFFENFLAIPIFIGKKSEREKFAGALYSTSCEALMMDGKALQIATSHNLGQNFSKPFNVMFQNNQGEREFVHQTSWGLSIRSIGGLILTHGDSKGLILPPKVAPIQVVIVPILGKGQEQDKITLEKSQELAQKLLAEEIRTELDLREEVTPGWKFNEWEVKGVPIRLEIGPRDLENKSVTLARRDLDEKTNVPMDNLPSLLSSLLQEIQDNLFKKAQKFLEENTREADGFQQFKDILEKHRGFIKADWCGDSECEKEIKEKTKATTRCIPFDCENITGQKKCFHCGKKAKKTPLWARAY